MSLLYKCAYDKNYFDRGRLIQTNHSVHVPLLLHKFISRSHSTGHNILWVNQYLPKNSVTYSSPPGNRPGGGGGGGGGSRLHFMYVALKIYSVDFESAHVA